MSLDKFCAVYRQQLPVAMQKYPQHYGWKDGDVITTHGNLGSTSFVASIETTANKMCDAFARGTFNHDSKAIMLTCKTLGIKHTRTAIKAFIALPE